MKNLKFLALVAVALLTYSCGDDDQTIEDVIDPVEPIIDNNLVGNITEDMTLTNDQIWNIQGRVSVTAGATLTIQPGTILKAQAGSGAQASTLIIARGAKIMAEGTAEQPIIFTTQADNIALGETAGTNLDENDRGLWGGLLVLGYAPASLKNGSTEIQIEGIPTTDTNGLYGGSDASDNSGVMKYISIRHGGASIGEGNEINGLTLGGVGSGTVIENVEVVANVDDGIEFFGGSVNAKNLFVWAQGDDALDIDQAYSGTIDNAMVVLGDASDHALEIDGPEGTLEGSFKISNLTIVGNTNTLNGEYADYRSKAMGTTENVLAYGFKEESDVELDNNGVANNFLDGKLSFANWQIVGADYTIFVEKTDNDAGEEKLISNPSFTDRAQTWATQVNEGASTTGADTSNFSWTYSNFKASLNL